MSRLPLPLHVSVPAMALSRPPTALPRGRRLRWPVATAAAALLALATGCTAMQQHHAKDQAAGASGTNSTFLGRTTAQARLKTPEGKDAGMATLTSVQSGGVEIAVQVQDMAPGPHGFHIHEKGECAPGPDAATGKVVAFGAAGGHFDPHGTKTHGQPGQSARQVHAGDVPNLVVGSSGSGMLRYTSQDVALAPGANSIVGLSLVVHAGEDDYKTNPAGNSGPRVACGVIEMVQGKGLERSNMAHGGAVPAMGQTASAPAAR